MKQAFASKKSASSTASEHLLMELDSLKADLTVASQTLQSKSEALRILSKSLEICEAERDEFKHMAEQVMNRYQLLRKTLSQGMQTEMYSLNGLSNLTNKQLASLLVESQEANKSLQKEIGELRTKLRESLGDAEILRVQLKASRHSSNAPDCEQLKSGERQHLVLQMEQLASRVTQLEHELARCSDEKEELASERDVYRNKCDRLNNELNYILNGNEHKIVDIDALIMERKSLKYRLQTVEEERKLALATLSKYQKLVERRSSQAPSTSSSDCPCTPSESPRHQGNTAKSAEATPDGVT
ncbi:unnamed protein product [Dicrocoelium dendriticum]|nr:unnamed protein product [Dicrocoelium dendriticum]